jgi:hypothetical protein
MQSLLKIIKKKYKKSAKNQIEILPLLTIPTGRVSAFVFNSINNNIQKNG